LVEQARKSNPEIIQGARYALATLLQDMSVDHGGSHIVMPEQLLNGADVGAALQQVGGKRMAKGVGACEPVPLWPAAYRERSALEAGITHACSGFKTSQGPR
jgi:hypothetical protein